MLVGFARVMSGRAPRETCMNDGSHLPRSNRSRYSRWILPAARSSGLALTLGRRIRRFRVLRGGKCWIKVRGQGNGGGVREIRTTHTHGVAMLSYWA